MVYPFDARALWLLDYLDVEKVALVGHSGGGSISRNMYFIRPARVWAFVNVDSGALGGRAYADRLPNSRCSAHVQELHRRNDVRLTRLEPQRIKTWNEASHGISICTAVPSLNAECDDH
jgi:pimeloyl-ACP methyl ester carboxylesterase